MDNLMKIREIIEPQWVREGAGVLLQRSISPRVSNIYDPFLLFDHFAFNDPGEGAIAGFPMHPHRGIETVTYMLEGQVDHKDSLGNAGTIEPGDVQWMTSGGGIMHEEMPKRSARGFIYGFQLWVNLPAALKLSQPNYQEVKAGEIPEVEQAGVRVRVVAGEVFGVQGPVREIAASPVYLEAALEPEAEFCLAIPEGHTTLAYVFEGEGMLGKNEVRAVRMAVLGEGSLFQAAAGEKGMRFMLMSGKPFGEPIVPYGPFVMNTQEEIRQALADLRAGTFVKG